MNKQILFILLSLFIFNVSISAQQNTLSKQKACDLLNVEEIAKLMNTEAINLVNEDMSFVENDRRSVCHYVVKGKIESYNVRMAWQSQKSIDKKSLEKRYTRYVENGEENMKKYESVPSEGDTEILYGEQASNNGVLYIMRKRFGTTAEVKIEVLKEQEDPELRVQMLDIINNIR